MDLGTIQQLATAVALSSLIGLEREHTYQMGSYTNFGGIRKIGRASCRERV